MSPKRRVDLFFDVVSPYAWIGFEAMCRYRTVWNIDLHLRPFFLGGIMNASGNRPPGIVPAKAKYMATDIKRQRQFWSIPLQNPEDFVGALFEKGSLQAQRYLVSLEGSRPELLEPAARELWMRRWSRDEDIHLPEHLEAVSKRIGLSDSESVSVIEGRSSQAVKELLKQSTEEAAELGAFGAPWIVIYDADGTKHSFFGSDRFTLISEILGEKYPGTMRELAKSKL